MNISPSKENILKKIRKALSESTPLPFSSSEGSQSVFVQRDEDLALVFAEAFSALQGRFAFCLNEQELAAQLKALIVDRKWESIYVRDRQIREQLRAMGIPALTEAVDMPALKACDASVTGCDCLVARTGTMVLSAGQESGRTTSVYAPVHICIAYTDQLVYDVRDGLKYVKDKYGDKLPSLISFATGPSRTADIEKTLVVGVHGPKEVFCFLVNSQH